MGRGKIGALGIFLLVFNQHRPCPKIKTPADPEDRDRRFLAPCMPILAVPSRVQAARKFV
jgi:hypothetical protein